MPPALAIRDGNWKLFVNHDGSHAQLFEIPKDIGEEHDVAAAHPDLVKSLTAKMLAWQKSLPPSKARDQVATTGTPQDAARKQGKTNAAKPASDRAAAVAEGFRRGLLRV